MTSPMIDENTFEYFPKGMYHMMALKAALSTNGDMVEFMAKAVHAYHVSIPLQEEYCLQCGTTNMEVLDNYEVPGDRQVVFEHVPTMICTKCKNQEWDLNVIAALDRISQSLPEGTRMSLEQAMQLQVDSHGNGYGLDA